MASLYIGNLMHRYFASFGFRVFISLMRLCENDGLVLNVQHNSGWNLRTVGDFVQLPPYNISTNSESCMLGNYEIVL